MLFGLVLTPKNESIWMEDLPKTCSPQTLLVFSMCNGTRGLMRTTPRVIPGHLPAGCNQALLSALPSPAALEACLVCDLRFPLGEEASRPRTRFSRHLFRLSFFPPAPSPLAAALWCAVPPHCWRGDGEKKSLSFVLQIQRVIIPSFPTDECVKIIVGS